MSDHANYQKWKRKADKALSLGQTPPPRPAKELEPLPGIPATVPCCHKCGEARLKVLVTYGGHVLCGNCVVLEKREDARGLLKVLSGREIQAPELITCPRCAGQAMLRPDTDPPQYLCMGLGSPANCFHKWVNEPKPREE